MITNFIRFVCDVSRGSRRTVRELQNDQVASVEGAAHYEEAKALGRGLIVATAHLGSFEVGMAELLRKEPRLHVVFQRDPVILFERMRHRLHQRLGVIEAPVDDGWEVWIRLREALERGEAVAMQADRVMPGQKGAWVPFAGGHIALPLGPVKLAKLTGAPILPVFAPVEADGRVRLVIEPAIVVDEIVAPGQTPAALIQLAQTLERFVLKYPDQWLVLFEAWQQDAESGCA